MNDLYLFRLNGWRSIPYVTFSRPVCTGHEWRKSSDGITFCPKCWRRRPVGFVPVLRPDSLKVVGPLDMTGLSLINGGKVGHG